MPMSESPQISLLGDSDVEDEDFLDVNELISDEGEYDGDESGSEMDVDENQRADLTLTPAKLIFSKHDDSVFCCAINKSSTLVASGGEDDNAYLWDITSGEVLLKSCHNDSVTFTAFNHDCSLVAAGDMLGYIRVWNIENRTKVCELECCDLFWMDWHPKLNVLFAGTEGGHLYMWKIPSGELKMFSGPGHDVDVARLLSDGKRIVGGFSDASIRVVDLKSMSTQFRVDDNESHADTITSIDTNNAMLCFTGSQDQTAKLCNTVTGKMLRTFSCGVAKPYAVEAVLLGNEAGASKNYSVTATLSGDVQVWDLSAETERAHLCLNKTVTLIDFDPIDQTKLYIGCDDGSVSLWDPRSDDVKPWQPHSLTVLAMNFTSDGNLMVTGSHDNTARVTDLRL